MKQAAIPHRSLKVLIGSSVLSLLGVVFLALFLRSQVQTSLSPEKNASITGTQIVASTTPTIPAASPVPTYMVYGLAVQATAQAIAQTLPTASPQPDIPIYKQPLYQQDDLWQRAVSTAMALNPPSGELQWEAFTPIVPQTALPTMHPVAQRAVGNGILYESSFVGPPCTMINPYNYWIGYISNQAVQICAGRVRSLPGGAILVAVRSNSDPPSTLSAEIYTTPNQQLGGVSITDLNGEQLTVQAADGTYFYFDLTTRQWVPPSPTPVPSLPPAP